MNVHLCFFASRLQRLRTQSTRIQRCAAYTLDSFAVSDCLHFTSVLLYCSLPLSAALSVPACCSAFSCISNSCGSSSLNTVGVQDPQGIKVIQNAFNRAAWIFGYLKEYVVENGLINIANDLHRDALEVLPSR